MPKQAELLVVEIDDDHDRNHYFPPLNDSFRGRFDASRASRHNKEFASMLTDWPDPIPGQRIGVNATTGEGFVEEPLHDDEYAVTRKKLTSRGFRLPPRRQAFSGVDVPAWLFHIKRAVTSAHARIVQGEVPDKIEGKPRISFVVDRPVNRSARLADALLAVMYAGVPSVRP